MNIIITCRKQRPEEEDHDALQPWLARSVFPEISRRAPEPGWAINFVKGACLHCIGDWQIVPAKIEFTVTIFPVDESA